METSDVFAAIKARFIAQWALTAYSAIPVYWPNQPDDVPPQFVRVNIQFGAARTASYGAPGSNVFRQSGELIFFCYAPSVDDVNGDAIARGMAEAAAKIFRAFKTGGSLRFYQSAPSGPGYQNGSLYCVEAIAAFDFDTLG